MDWGSPVFVISIIAITTFGWVLNNWIRAQHGYALEDEWGGKTEKPASNEIELLTDENRTLTGRLESTEDRLAVLERIITDEGYNTAREIEALRDKKEDV